MLWVSCNPHWVHLVVKERSKCGQLWTLEIKECLWSYGSLRLIGGVPGIVGAQNGVSSEREKKEKRRTKNMKEKKKEKRKRREEKERKRKRDSLNPGERGLSHFEEDFLQF